MMVRAVRTENRLTYANWCADVHQGQVLTVNETGAPGTIGQQAADYFIAHGAMIDAPDGAVHDAWWQARTDDPTDDGVPAPEESRVGTHFDTVGARSTLVDGDVGGGFIHVSLLNAPTEGA